MSIVGKGYTIFNDDCMNHLDVISENTCIVTDPPFNIGYKYNTYNDNKDTEEYWGGGLKKLLSHKDVPAVIIHYPEQLYKLSHVIGKIPEKVVTWVYNANTKKQHRDIAFFGISPDFSKVKQPYKNPNDKRVQKLIAQGSTGTDIYDWWFINQVKNVSKEKTSHPCQMPLEVMLNIVGILPNDFTIFDPFMGSGTTGVACKKLNRNFIGCELDPYYFLIADGRLYGDYV